METPDTTLGTASIRTTTCLNDYMLAAWSSVYENLLTHQHKYKSYGKRQCFAIRDVPPSQRGMQITHIQYNTYLYLSTTSSSVEELTLLFPKSSSTVPAGSGSSSSSSALHTFAPAWTVTSAARTIRSVHGWHRAESSNSKQHHNYITMAHNERPVTQEPHYGKGR